MEVLPGDLPGFPVDALAEPDVGIHGKEIADVGQCPAHVGLEHHTHVAVPFLQVAVDPQGGVGAGVVLHVDPDEIAVGGGQGHDLLGVGPAVLLVDPQTQERELDGDVAVQLELLDGVEDAHVLPDGSLRLLPLPDLLAQDVHGGHGALCIELPDGPDRVVQCLSGHVPPGHRTDDELRHQRQPVLHHGVEDAHPHLPDHDAAARTAT